MWLLIVLALIFIIWLIVKPYVQKYDNVILYTGGLGSGKTLTSVNTVYRLWKKNTWKVRFHNLLHPRDRWQKPEVYSTIPLHYGKYWSIPLDPKVPVLSSWIVPRSVIFFDEVSLYVDQLQLKFPNADNYEEFATLFRHYSLGGYIVMNTQNSSKVNFHTRYTVNQALCLYDFKKYFVPIPFLCKFIYVVKCKNVSLAEDIKTIQSDPNLEDGFSNLFGLIPWQKEFDTYCYSERAREIPLQSDRRYSRIKSCMLVQHPKIRLDPRTVSVDPPEEELSRKTRKATRKRHHASALDNAEK